MGKPKQESLDVDGPEPTKIKDSTIVKMFDGAQGQRGTKVHCPAFWELKWANGCYYDCQWCFLNGTYRFLDRGKTPNLKSMPTTLEHIKAALLLLRSPVVFNAGELSDGFVFPEAMIERIMPLFSSPEANPHNHKLLILTKSDTKRGAYANSKNIIIAHSVNAQYVARTYELKAPHPWNRIEASNYYFERGFETRLRIDPMVPVNSWHVGYKELVERIMDKAPNTSVITIGSLRGLQSTINMCKNLKKDISWMRYIEGGETTNFGKRASVEVRIAMYTLVKNTLLERGYKGQIALCKETPEVWKAVGLDMRKAVCNCILEAPSMKDKKQTKKVVGEDMTDTEENLKKVKGKIVNDEQDNP